MPKQKGRCKYHAVMFTTNSIDDLKCDQGRPRCFRCTKSGRTCGGYRSELDLMFCDETASIVDKAQARAIKISAHRPPECTDMDAIAELSSQTDPKSTEWKKLLPKVSQLSMALSVSAEDQATSFFFSNYVFDEERHSRGNFSFLPTLYRHESIESLLSVTVTSVGMAGLSNMARCSTIGAAAKRKYVRALALTNDALRNPQQAVEDRTLIAIMLLSMFEVVASSTKQSLDAWHKHITGAAALIQLRGSRHTHSETSTQVLLQMRFMTIVRCLHHGLHVPNAVQEFGQRSQFQKLPDHKLQAEFVHLVIACCSLRADNKHRTMTPANVLHKALELDAELLAWAVNLPEHWRYHAVRASKSEDALEDHYHIYNNLWTANIWNCYRTVRMLINAIIAGSVDALPTSLSSDVHERDQSRLMICKLSRDVCASVPFHFRRHEADTQPNAVRGYYLFWPLYVAGLADGEARPWIVSQLRAIGQTMGIQQAITLAEDLASGHTWLKRN